MNNDLEDLGDRIEALQSKRQARENPKGAAPSDNNNKGAGVQAGLEFVFSIGLAVFIGYKLDVWMGTSPLWLIVLFFLGVGAGFWSLYKFSLKFSSSKSDSQLHPEEKTANKAPEND